MGLSPTFSISTQIYSISYLHFMSFFGTKKRLSHPNTCGVTTSSKQTHPRWRLNVSLPCDDPDCILELSFFCKRCPLRLHTVLSAPLSYRVSVWNRRDGDPTYSRPTSTVPADWVSLVPLSSPHGLSKKVIHNRFTLLFKAILTP